MRRLEARGKSDREGKGTGQDGRTERMKKVMRERN